MDTRQIGIVTVARSDRGHTDILRKALNCPFISPRMIPTWCRAVLIPTDRWEMGVAAMSALGRGVPIIQLHAGEYTPYAFDDDIRHFISRVATLRFCCHGIHRQRLLKAGIPDRTIHVCGAPGLDKLLLPRLSRATLARQLTLDPDWRWAIVILHPTTHRAYSPAKEMRAAKDAVGTHEAIWFTPCNDPGREAYLRPGQINTVTDLQWRTLLYEADVMIGNSSALVIEAPFVGLKTVEIGWRQRGRDRVPYGDGQSVPRIVKILEEWTP